MNFKKGQLVPNHAHPNEQCGYVISGKHKITIADVQTLLKSGDSYSIPKNVKHSWEVLISGEVIDFFTPPRTDYYNQND
jgi:quercetin dioxygenase-like cupin family protein